MPDVSTTHGKGATLEVSVSGDGATAPTGDVTVAGLGTKALASGVASFDVPADLPAGTRTYAVAYAGDANHLPATGTATVTVAKASVAAPRITMAAPATTVRGGTVTLDLTAGGAQPTGKVTVALTKGKEKRTVLGTLAKGKVAVAVPALSAGTWRATVTYAGDASYAATTGTTTFVVRKAAVAKPVVKVVKRSTTKKAGSVRVTVRSTTAGTPTGKVRVQLVKGRSTRTYTVTLNSRGLASVKTSKLAKGSWKVYVTYLGDARFDPRAKTRVSTIKVTR